MFVAPRQKIWLRTLRNLFNHAFLDIISFSFRFKNVARDLPIKYSSPLSRPNKLNQLKLTPGHCALKFRVKQSSHLLTASYSVFQKKENFLYLRVKQAVSGRKRGNMPAVSPSTWVTKERVVDSSSSQIKRVSTSKQGCAYCLCFLILRGLTAYADSNGSSLWMI